MNVEVNWLAIVLAVVAAMIVGMVWYSKSVFGTVWMHLAGLDKSKNTQVVAPMLTAVLGSLLTAYVIAHVAYISHAFFKNSFFMDAVTTSFWLWLGLSVTSLMIHNSFEQKPWKLTALAVGNRFVTYLAMGIVIGLLQP